MRVRTPKKKQFLGFYSPNDVVLDVYDTKQHRFGRQQYFFLIPGTSQNDVVLGGKGGGGLKK